MFGAPDSLSHSTLVKSIVATNKKIPLEQRAHFYTGASPVCALCEADSPDDGSPGCFASLHSEQGAAPLATLARLSQRSRQDLGPVKIYAQIYLQAPAE